MPLASLQKGVARLTTTDVLYARDLILSLLRRDIHGRYKDSRLGLAWAVIHPLLYLFIFYFLFRMVFSLSIPRYSSFAFTGVLVWTWFQSSLLQSASVVQHNQDLVRQPGFPPAVLPIVTVSSNLVNFLIALPVLMIFLVAERGMFGPELIALIPLMVLQFALVLALAYVVGALNVLFRDTQHLLAVALQLFFFLTPIFYDLENVPEKYRWFIQANPLAHLIGAYRSILVEGTWPDGASVAIVALCAVAIFPIGYAYFRVQSRRFLEEL